MVRSTVDDLLFDESTNEALRNELPEAVVSFLEVATHLGDGVTLIVFGTLLYWFGGEDDQRKRALVIGIGLGALALSAGMKGIFAAPRPELAFTPAEYPGYSFPSAHALGAAAFYGGLAAVADTGSRFQRYLLAGVVIFLVAFSRLVMGVHYLGDVVVGVVVGLAFVAVVVRSPDPEPGTLFALSGAIAVLAFLLGSTYFVTLTIGASIGALIGWRYTTVRPSNARGASLLVLGYLLIPPLIVLRWWSPSLPGRSDIAFLGYGADVVGTGVEIVGYAIATAVILAVPVIGARANDWPQVVWLQETLPFRGRRLDPEQVEEYWTEE
ncbi:phosphatase PAP2 family protein [Halovivax sp.]|uniref:phosphatase PAP2 family protein n=1 Tax=Halovivax sp. TaxID=1935978 RepID=UPI0025C27521|nr:phosphatase PAP2 family protein [Halovivax sp.]